MLFTSIPDPNLFSENLGPLELRLDLFPRIDLSQIEWMIQTSSHPIMLSYRGPINALFLRKLTSLRPRFFDLDSQTITPEILEEISLAPEIEWVISYHNFSSLPPCLETLYSELSRIPANHYKIACMCNSALDALSLLLFAKGKGKVSPICMGEKGAFGRILAPIVQGVLNYAAKDAKHRTAKGQYTYEEMTHIYHFQTLSPATKIYGLLGSPVDKSRGHLYHNQVFREKNIDAVYVKIDLLPEELSSALPLLSALGFQGFSVTMPLKEKILPYVDGMDPFAKKVGAINTLRLDKGRLLGINTDGYGAVDALEKKTKLEGKTVLLIGAGGSARAIGYALCQKKANVWILNRTKKTFDFPCHFGKPPDYDIIINCLPFGIEGEMPKQNKIAMDIVYEPKETPFLKIGRERGCEIIYGEEMFLSQAAAQTQFWLCTRSHFDLPYFHPPLKSLSIETSSKALD